MRFGGVLELVGSQRIKGEGVPGGRWYKTLIRREKRDTPSGWGSTTDNMYYVTFADCEIVQCFTTLFDDDSIWSYQQRGIRWVILIFGQGSIGRDNEDRDRGRQMKKVSLHSPALKPSIHGT